MADDFFEIPGASGNNGGGGGGQGASDAAPADRNAILEQRLDRMGRAIDTLLSKDQKSDKAREKDDYQRRIVAEISKKNAEVDAAEKALAEAYEEGDGATIARAQRNLSALTATVERMKAEGRAALQQFDQKAEADGKDLDTSNLDRWKGRNSTWYGVDAEMTRAAHEIDRELRSEGAIEVGSNEYFEAIDRRLQRKYPDRMKGTPGSASQSNNLPPTSSGGVTRIPADVAEGWRRMGINIDDPEVAKRMMDHRQTAVNKGILSTEPRFGRVIERR